MISEFICSKFPEYAKMNEAAQKQLMSQLRKDEDLYEEFRLFAGKRVFERDDFEEWEFMNFNEFFIHPKYLDFDLLCTLFIGQGKDHFFLTDHRHKNHKSLYESDIETFNFQKDHVPHLVEYHPYPFPEMYAMVRHLDGKDKVVSGTLQSFQHVLTNMMFEFSIRHSNAINGPTWMEEKDLDYFQRVAHQHVRDNGMYNIISDANVEISKYMEENDFIFIDKSVESFYKTYMPNWDIYISSIESMKSVMIDAFTESIQNKTVEKIPEDFKDFFLSTIYKAITRIIDAFKAYVDSAEKNQIGTLREVRSFRPLRVFFHPEALDDISKLEDEMQKISDEIEAKEGSDVIKNIKGRYILELFNPLYGDLTNEMDRFHLHVASRLLQEHPELREQVSNKEY